MIFFENERSQVRTLRASFREIARIFTTLGGFNLGWHWLQQRARTEIERKNKKGENRLVFNLNYQIFR